MKIEIKNRWNNEIIVSGDYESIKDCVEKSDADLRCADLRCADLRGADLRDADLRDADLRGAYLGDADLRGAYLGDTDLRDADLRGANYNGEKLKKEPIQILGLKYFILITKEQIKIGCELHKANEWKKFADKRILEMDGQCGLIWWKKNKRFVMACHKKHLEDTR